jgi:hypothetical protein
VALHAGVVDEDVASAKLLPGLLDQVLDVGGFGDVGLNEDGLAAGGLDLVLGVLGALDVTALVNDDGGAFTAETDGDGLANARTGAGNDCDLACEASCHIGFFSVSSSALDRCFTRSIRAG